MTLGSDVSVSIQTAAERAGVGVEQIRRWADVEGLEIQHRGRLEIVRLDRVLALSAAARRNDPNSSRGALRARLADAAGESRGITNLQRLARGRSDDGPR